MPGSLRECVVARQQFVPPARLADGITTRVAHSTMWSGLGIGAGTVLQFARSVVFARLLMPADFGIVNLANAFAQFIMIFANFGFTASVVHHDGLEQKDLATLWWGNVAVDAAAALVCCLIAAISGHVTHNPKLLPVMALLASQFILTSLGSVNLALLQRTFRYRELAISDLTAAAVTFGVGYLFMKTFHWGVYGLLGAMVLATGVSSLLNISFLPWLPSFRFCFASLRKHFNYGRWFLGVNLATYANVSADRFAIGHLLSTTQLGFYEYASNIPMQIVTKVSQMLNSVLFSAFSTARNDPAQMHDLLQKFYRYNALVTFPVLTGIALVAPEFVKVAYGDVWTPIIPGIRLFCLYGALLLYVQPFHAISNGVGKPYLPLRWMLIYLPINLGLIWLGVHFGQLNGAILVRSVMPAFVVLTLGREVMRLLRVPWSLLLRATVPAATACAAMAAIVLGVDRLAAGLQVSPPVHLAMATLAGAVTYGVMLVTFWRAEVRKLWEVVARR